MIPLFVAAVAGLAYLAHNDPSYRDPRRRSLVLDRISTRTYQR